MIDFAVGVADLDPVAELIRPVGQHDDAAHYVLGVALQATGSVAEATREKELARQLSSQYGVWESKQPGTNAAPPRLERIKTDLDVPAALRVENVIVASGQRAQRDLAAFHLAAGRRAYDAERDVERKKALVDKKFISPAELDKAQVVLDTTREQLKAVQAQIKVSEAQVASARAAV